MILCIISSRFEVGPVFVHSYGGAEDITMSCMVGIGFYGDNDPAPENIPESTSTASTTTISQ